MNSKLDSLSDILRGNILRIPDYQRGYAWEKKEVLEFWEDISILESNRLHYSGVITLEPVKENVHKRWNTDSWMVEQRNIQPYYIVDGQQRITTAMILLSAILRILSDKFPEKKIDSNKSKEDIIKTYIYEVNKDETEKTFLFSYEKENDSYGYYIKNILGEPIDINTGIDISNNKYTTNLQLAFDIFLEKCNKLSFDELDELYGKLMYRVVYNQYVINSELDIFVTFETMNNRGKLLSKLELLKNRLIYLTTLFDSSALSTGKKDELREKINNCWKRLFKVLGQYEYYNIQNNKNKTKITYYPINPINTFLDNNSDDLFLREQIRDFDKKSFINLLDGLEEELPFNFDDEKEDITNYLDENNILKYVFTAKNIAEGKLKVKQIEKYIEDLSESIDVWFSLRFPLKSEIYAPELQIQLRKLSFLLEKGFNNRYYYSINNPDNIFNNFKSFQFRLLKEFYKNNIPEDIIFDILKHFEDIIFFIQFNLIIEQETYYKERSFNNTFNFLLKEFSVLIDTALKSSNFDFSIFENECKILKHKFSNQLTQDSTLRQLKKIQLYEVSSKLCKYILLEYENFLIEEAKNNVSTEQFNLYSSLENMNIEHIYPKNGRNPYWNKYFPSSKVSDYKKDKYKNSLANLILISRDKNNALENKGYDVKRDNKNSSLSFLNGNYSEKFLANSYTVWNPDTIKDRSNVLASFLEKRWGIKLKDQKSTELFFGIV